jgi:TrmH family RNA methyltransferase
MEKVSDTEQPQGIMCLAQMPSWTREQILGKGQESEPLLLILEDVRDPGNLGTIFRTAEAAGATGILMSRGTVDLFNPKVVRATMSAIFRMPFMICDDLCRELETLRGDGIRSYAAHLGGTRAYDELPLTGGSAFLIGNEANGLTEETIAACRHRLTIPMAGRAESLNAAVAAALVLWEMARRDV